MDICYPDEDEQQSCSLEHCLQICAVGPSRICGCIHAIVDEHSKGNLIVYPSKLPRSKLPLKASMFFGTCFDNSIMIVELLEYSAFQHDFHAQNNVNTGLIHPKGAT